MIQNERAAEPSRRQSRAGQWRDEFLFRLRPPDWAAVVSPTLTFGDAANGRFRELVGGSASYLEFGAGSSTIEASEAGRRFTTVESDPGFLMAVERKCQSGSGTFLYADIGPTGPWGVPRHRRVTPERVSRWQGYPLAPWRSLGGDFRADVVLVDGRFRVACVLAVVTHQGDSDWTVLFDDYVDRPEYTEIEEYASLVGCHGRMAEFNRRADVDLTRAQAAFERFSVDWR